MNELIRNAFIGWRNCIAVDIVSLSDINHVLYLHFDSGVRPEIAVISIENGNVEVACEKYKNMIEIRYK